MKIFLVRHAQDDAACLSELGKRQAFSAANFLKMLGFQEGEITLLHSPVRRAAETASIITESLGSAIDATCQREWLDVDSDDGGRKLEREIDHLLNTPKTKALVVVSHAPTLESIFRYFSDCLGYNCALRNIQPRNCTTVVLNSETKMVEAIFHPNL